MNSKNNIHVLARAVIIDQGHILLCKTLDLPISFYFLPGGHVEHGESAHAAVLRELQEEAGCAAQIKRFLGVFEHSFEPGHNSICHNHEYNLIFEATADILKFGYNVPQCEDHIKLIWIPLDKLTKIDFRPESLRGIISKWLASKNHGVFNSVMR